ncbi:heterokaryon incompatibility protein-domain-containing protein [Stachybotrys elegans]|uniref:Heterokaryon incompatibility protein-domain-containing protein n=1 Tax=Stachybotrys elegans TaxID=80388 RepID=A0A8K0SVF0_9HYPO|nr:heterokaryon incompatibility protein-domain-containing protein [Stachybotrys elegans]
MSKNFDYAPIAPGWIRLLEIVSVSPKIVLRVETTSLDSPPPYLALSYCWGTLPPVDVISLETGLMDAMGSYVGSRIWIDAICINQQDDQEKSHQVQAMDKVYQQAETVLIWLGAQTFDSDTALRGIRDYGGAAFAAGILNFTTQQYRAWPDLAEYPEHHKTRDTLLRLMQKAADAEGDATLIEHRLPRLAFARLSHREYFTRVWVKQEVTLASKAIILCGNESAALEHLHALTLFYGLLQMWEVREWRAGRASRIPGPFSEEELMNADNVVELLASATASDAIGNLFSGQKKHRHGDPQSLYDLLYACYVRSSSQVLCCQDPRDKIWGLAGIASDMDELELTVSYEESAKDIYEKTARSLLQQGRIEILTWCRSREMQPPTWVPNLALPIRPPWSNDTGTPLFRATGNRCQPEEVWESEAVSGMVRLHGVVVDIVNECGSIWRADPGASFDQQSFLAIVSDLWGYLEKSRYTEDQKQDAIWRIPIGDKEFPDASPYFVRGTERSAEQFRSLISKRMNSDVNAETYSYQACMGCTYMAKPLLTNSGHVGLGPSEMMANDQIVLLWGGSTPYVVREREDQQGYFLVGEAYIYGIMDGEFADALETGEATKVFQLW